MSSSAEYLSIGKEFDAQMRVGAEEERRAFLEQGEIPQRIRVASDWLNAQVETRSQFYQTYQGLCVVAVSVEPPVMEIGPDLFEVRIRTRERWGVGIVASQRMDGSALTNTEHSRPRLLRAAAG